MLVPTRKYIQTERTRRPGSRIISNSCMLEKFSLAEKIFPGKKFWNAFKEQSKMFRKISSNYFTKKTEG